MDHYTKTKEEKTAELMKRVLEILIDAPEPMDMNGKVYKKINFSQGQVLNGMHHYATPEEKIEGIVFRDASTISHNDTYKKMIRNAKDKRARRLTEDCDLSFGARKPTEAEMLVAIDRLTYDKNRLLEEKKGLESVIEQAGIESYLEADGPIVNDPIGIDKKLLSAFEKLLTLGSAETRISIEKGQGGQSSKVLYHGFRGSEFICYVDDLKELNVEFGKDDKGRLIIKEKGLIYG